jgi:hypothetical protein
MIVPTGGAPDMWALGCCLAFIASGRDLFRNGPYGEEDARIGPSRPDNAMALRPLRADDGKDESVCLTSLERRMADFLADPPPRPIPRMARTARSAAARLDRTDDAPLLPADRIATVDAVLFRPLPGRRRRRPQPPGGSGLAG